MSILDLRTEDMLDALPRVVAPKPMENGSTWSAIGDGITAVPRGVLGASAEVMASASELAFAPFKRRSVATATEAMRNDFADSLRDRGKDFAPDPNDASMAEQVLYGFARGATKVVGGAMLAGPAGVVAAGLEEANTVSVELADKGVDPETRARAAAVQGAGLALAALPVVGQTLKATAALYVAGGPGGFMAQQALTRQILTEGGYTQLAAGYDPFDPVGLAVSSLVPAVFAGVGIRGQRRAAAARAAEEFRAGPMPSEPAPLTAAVREAFAPEVVDAARVAYTGEVRRTGARAPGLRGADMHEDALARVEAAMARGDSVQVSDLVPPTVIESLPDFLARAKVKPEPIPPEVTGEFVGWVARMGGIDFAQKWDITNERGGVLSNPGGIFRRGGLGVDDLALQAEAAGYLKPGEGQNSRAFVDLVQQAVRGERVLTYQEQMAKMDRAQRMDALGARLEAAEDRMRLLGVDPVPAGGNIAALEAYLRANEPRLLGAALDEAAAVQPGMREHDALVERAQQVAADIRESARTLENWEAEVQPLSPVMRRLVAEELKPARVPRAADPAAPTESPPPRQPAADATPAASAETGAAASRLVQIQATMPDLMVRMDGDEAARPLSEFLAAAKAEADEFAADAPLMQVAAECALLNGP